MAQKNSIDFLSIEEIEANANRFIELLESVNIPGANIPGLIEWLKTTDFFIAPASTKYHGSFKGGLCAHSLLVYDNMMKLFNEFVLPDTSIPPMDENSIKVVSLLHDLSKVNQYTLSSRNEKEYLPADAPANAKSKGEDALGRFSWVTTISYALKDGDERFVLVDHDVNAAYLANIYIPLSQEEFAAIANHSGGMTNKFSNPDLNTIFKKYPLVLYLHMADMIACYHQQI